jgi:hypothetical protein
MITHGGEEGDFLANVFDVLEINEYVIQSKTFAVPIMNLNQLGS